MRFRQTYICKRNVTGVGNRVGVGDRIADRHIGIPIAARTTVGHQVGLDQEENFEVLEDALHWSVRAQTH